MISIKKIALVLITRKFLKTYYLLSELAKKFSNQQHCWIGNVIIRILCEKLNLRKVSKLPKIT